MKKNVFQLILALVAVLSVAGAPNRPQAGWYGVKAACQSVFLIARSHLSDKCSGAYSQKP